MLILTANPLSFDIARRRSRSTCACAWQVTSTSVGMVSFDTLSLGTTTEVIQWNSSYARKDSGDFATFIDATTHPSSTMAPTWLFCSGSPGHR